MAFSSALEGKEAGGSAPARLRRRVPYPIAALPLEMKAGGEVLLFCGDRQGWHLAAWSEGAWRAASDPGLRLEPSHFALASGLANEDGRWRHAVSRRVMVLSAVGVIAAVILGMMAIGQVAYGDPWALCAPTRDVGSATSAS
jgi:hypothetical protein